MVGVVELLDGERGGVSSCASGSIFKHGPEVARRRGRGVLFLARWSYFSKHE